MPSPTRLVLPQESLLSQFRRRPLALAAVAATGGLLCGALVAVVSVPSKPAPTVAAAPVSAPAQTAAAKPEQAKTDDGKVGENGCENQTWPYIARSCLTEAKTETKPETRGVRVVSTDKLAAPTIGAIEKAGAPKPAERVAQAPATTVAANDPPPAVHPSSSNPPEVTAAIKALDYSQSNRAAVPAAAPAAEPVVATSTPAPEAAPAEPAKSLAAEKSRRSRVAKSTPRKPVDLKPQAETVASSTDDEDDIGRRVVQSRDGSGRRIVQRWIERDYRNEDGRTQRVIVVQRPASTGIFGRLFGDSYAARDDD